MNRISKVVILFLFPFFFWKCFLCKHFYVRDSGLLISSLRCIFQRLVSVQFWIPLGPSVTIVEMKLISLMKQSELPFFDPKSFSFVEERFISYLIFFLPKFEYNTLFYKQQNSLGFASSNLGYLFFVDENTQIFYFLLIVFCFWCLKSQNNGPKQIANTKHQLFSCKRIYLWLLVNNKRSPK